MAFAQTSLAQHTVASSSSNEDPAGAATALLTHPITVSLSNVSLHAAVKAIGAAAGTQLQFRGWLLDNYQAPVSVHAEHAPLGATLDRVLAGTRLRVVPLTNGLLAIVEDSTTPEGRISVITGRVLDAGTHRPLAGATVIIDRTTRGVGTESDGTFRLPAVPSGSHTITVRYLGYVRRVMQVNVGEDATTAMPDVMLTQAANQLDQVVVTGTVVATERRAIPNAITVITAKELEQRGITHIDQLFRGDVPGLFAVNVGASAPDQVVMFSRGATSLGLGGVAATNPMKTYVDGVELSDPSYLNQIDPRSIERIEILAGPQASTIYGSNAINGVMQIFTKRGTTLRPQLTATLLTGGIQNNFSSAISPQHDVSGQVSGTENRIAYNAGGSWQYVGPWTPAMRTTRTGGYGGVRMQAGSLTADASIRLNSTEISSNGGVDQVRTRFRNTGFWRPSLSNGYSPLTQTTQSGQTLGLSLTYAPTTWWSNEAGVGNDVSNVQALQNGARYAYNGDTLLLYTQSQTRRMSTYLRSTTRVQLLPSVQTTVTGGIEGWQALSASTYESAASLTGVLAGTSSLARQPDHNRGAFIQGQLGVADALFLTYGLRAEWNPNYGDNVDPNLAPRYGVAMTHDFGFVTAKVRGSYGRATRPPTAQEKSSIPGSVIYGSSAALYPPFDFQRSNPDLAPESQQGGEGGVELYFGNRASLVVTRYNQTVNDLISEPQIDSVRSLTTDPYGPGCCNGEYFYAGTFQYLNIGSLRNQGWELQGTTNVGALTAKGTYSWTKSRVIGITSRYRDAVELMSGNFIPGASFGYLPEHTWALDLSYTLPSTTLELDINRAGPLIRGVNADMLSLVTGPSVRLQQSRPRINLPGTYVTTGTSYTMANLNASHRFSSLIEGILQLQNLTNFYQNDLTAAQVVMGRQTKLGARLRL